MTLGASLAVGSSFRVSAVVTFHGFSITVVFGVVTTIVVAVIVSLLEVGGVDRSGGHFLLVRKS